ncbi:hypothetical protein LTR36_008296 [Oleoguttula mirabilis]|uniref:Uncharacterized protein n=1 Tax=Oleoguttula mirabilis TaxID=1507867 RepID=A0AAV9J7N8_9PEZI|nr:hypothetical protein LTR36_008296 [Oleoguttula mirabilis]
MATTTDASMLSPSSASEERRAAAPKPSTFATAAEPSAEARIPSKFLLETQAFPADGFYSITRSSEATAAITINTTSDAELVAAAPLDTAPTPTSAKFRDDLPDMPEWAVGLMAGLLAFALVVTVILYLANFPPTFTWIDRILRQRMKTRYGYARVGGDDDDNDGDDSDGSRRAKGRRASVDDSDGCYATSSATKGSSTRRRNSLIVDTSAQYTGLGIALPGDEQTMLRKRRRSYDEEAMRMRRLKPNSSPVKTAWAALTAPLPSVSLFGHSVSESFLTRGPHTAAVGGGYARKDRDMEDGVSPGLETDASTSDYATSPYKRSAQDPLYGPETSAEIDGLFGRLGSGMEHAVGRLAQAFHDQVGSAEEGLVLPVKDCERELALP